MSILKSKGAETIDRSEQTNFNGGGNRDRVEYLRLKSGEFARVLFLRDDENSDVFATVEYDQHNDFQRKITSHACIRLNGECPSCEAGVPLRTRYLIALYVPEKEKEVVVEMSRRQFNAIKTAIQDYLSDGTLFDMIFKLSKVGQGTETTFAISPILKPTQVELAYIEELKNKTVGTEFFERAIFVMTPQKMREFLKDKVKTSSNDTEQEEDPTKQF